MSGFRIALAQYPIDFHDSFSAYETKISDWVAQAATASAKLLVFPEYGSMELISLVPESIRNDLDASVDAMQEFWPAYTDLHRKLSANHGVYILASSFPVQRKNKAMLFAPNGKEGFQDKLIMTRFEREDWKIEAGQGINIFDTELGKIGVAICYDCEFPLLVRNMAEAGAEIILVPSCTDTMAGYSRVRIGAQARALENQCYVAQSPTVQESLWSPATDTNIGAAGLFGPPDVGFPDTGIIVQGEFNQPCWLYGEVNLSKVSGVRRHGQVRNFLYWDEQGKNAEIKINMIPL